MEMSQKKILCFYFFNLTIYSIVFSQNNNLTNNKILENYFNQFDVKTVYHRPFIDTKKSKFNPLIYLSGSLLYSYQNLISEQIQANCNYKISCSENMKQQIKNKGILLGIFNGLNQLANCAESVTNDYPNYKITKGGKIDNSTE